MPCQHGTPPCDFGPSGDFPREAQPCWGAVECHMDEDGGGSLSYFHACQGHRFTEPGDPDMGYKPEGAP